MFLQLLVHPIKNNRVIKLTFMFILFSEEYDTFTIFRGFARHPHEIRRVLVHVIPGRTIQQYIILFLEQVKDPGIRRPLVN